MTFFSGESNSSIKQEINFLSVKNNDRKGNGKNRGNKLNFSGEYEEDLSISAESDESNGDIVAPASEENFAGEIISLENFNMNNFNADNLDDAINIPKKLCLVCNDFASGLHYGIPSCEACKAFFKRTVQGNVEYSCSANESCEITKRRRKACQACRYKKCLAVGMLKEGVRIDRVRGGRQKYRRSEPNISSFGSQISKISLEHKMMTEALMSVEPEKVYAMPDKSQRKDGHSFNLALSDLADRELVATIGWAKLVPGFSDLPLPDQMNILQNSWLDIFLLNISYRSMPYFDVIAFSDDLSLSTNEAEVYEFYPEFDTQLRRLCHKVTSLKITKEEYIYMKAILLFNPDVRLIHNEVQVQKNRELMQDHLQEVAIVKGLQGTARLCSLVFLIASINQVKSFARDYWLAIKKAGKVKLHKLLGEMLEFLEDS